MDPRLQTLSNILGLPGADEPPKPLETQRRVLADFPAQDYAMQLFDAYCEYVAPIHNIIHPVWSVASVLTVANGESDDGDSCKRWCALNHAGRTGIAVSDIRPWRIDSERRKVRNIL